MYVCQDGYKAQFLRYLDKNFMEGVFQYYLEVLFLVFEKKIKKKFKNLKTGFSFKKVQFSTDFRYLLRFGNYWSVEIFFCIFSKVIFDLFRAILNFLVSVKNGGDQDFLYFVSIDEISKVGKFAHI